MLRVSGRGKGATSRMTRRQFIPHGGGGGGMTGREHRRRKASGDPAHRRTLCASRHRGLAAAQTRTSRPLGLYWADWVQGVKGSMRSSSSMRRNMLR